MNNRILIVGNAEGYFELLSNNNDKCNIFTLGNVKHLSSFLQKQAVDLLLLIIEDNFFEEVNEIERVKFSDDYKDIPVIVVDKSPSIPNNIKLAFQSGVTEYLKGNTDDIELLSRIDNQLKYSKRMAEIVEENSVNRETLQLMDKLVLFMDKADNSFIIFNADGEIEWVNEGFNRLYGYSIDEFKRKFGRTIFDASKNSEISHKVDKCINTKKSINYVAECQTRSGEFKWIQTTFTPIVVSPAGNIERYIAIETDITKLKETEEALNQKNEYMMALTNHLKSANTLLEEQQREINQQNKAIEEERKKSEDLLLNILPFEVARQLKSKGEAKPRNFKFTTVLFLDFINFTSITNELSPADLVESLDSYFTKFDEIVEKHFVEKIKTIGDAYMCVGGLPLRNRSNPFNVVLAALEMQRVIFKLLEETKTGEGLTWQCRIGIHTGSVMAGVVGKKKYIYDIWGNTVNIAARMQQESESGMVNVSGETYNEIKEYFDCTYRGKIAMKNSDDADMYFVNRLKDEYSSDETGLLPNETFLKMLNAL